MRIESKLIGLLIAGTASAVVPACGSGTYVVATTYEEPPPPPREEYVSYREGHVWVHGNWVRDESGRWRWQSGYFVRDRPGYVYCPVGGNGKVATTSGSTAAGAHEATS